MRRIVANSLERIGHNDCVEAASGGEALACIGTAIDCVITASHLPDMNGPQLVRAVRAMPLGSATPILMMVPRRARGDMDAARDAGVNDCLMKPFTPRILKAKVEGVVASPPAGA
jgi:two-component system chemotaxis response regulator CheY